MVQHNQRLEVGARAVSTSRPLPSLTDPDKLLYPSQHKISIVRCMLVPQLDDMCNCCLNQAREILIK